MIIIWFIPIIIIIIIIIPMIVSSKIMIAIISSESSIVVSILMSNKSLIIFPCCLLSPQVQVYLMYVEHKSRIDLHDVPVSSIYCYVDYQHAVLGDLHD